MEDLLAQERAAERHVHNLMKDPNQPITNLLQAYDQYRQLCQANVLADFGSAEKREARLWQAHTDGKRFFSGALKDLRKSDPARPVETRQLIKLYLHFLKGSERFYRGYIHKLSATFGGIPELDAVAHQVKSNGVASESESSPSLDSSPELRARVLASCHQTLIYLGDLSRYRASEQLDKKPDFGPALGYYGLACTLRPSSGMGHHQQAVVALEQRHHLRAIYHLYRAIVVDDPHPNATNNLKLEFDKTNSAWKKGELLGQGPPNDPEAPKRMLTGWLVRMHSMCYKGQPFKGHDELEHTLLTKLAAVVKDRALDIDSTLMRMLMVNLAAQHNASELFQGMFDLEGGLLPKYKLTSYAVKQSLEYQQAFFYFLRLNVCTYTSLLQIFYDEVRAVDPMAVHDDELAPKLSPTARRILPGLRLYSAWLLPNVHLLAGLASDDFLQGAIDAFWHGYTRVIGLLADEDVFGVWALDDYNVPYMLEEDADTVGYHPLQNHFTKVWSNWYKKETGVMKPRFSDAQVVRWGLEEEMLARVKGLLDDGMHLAYEVKEAPITLLGTRVYHGEPPGSDVEAYDKAQQELKGKAWPKPKPLSYAAAAANARAAPAVRASMPNGSSSTSSRSRQAQLSRMVDELVDDDDGNNPVTPPQQHAANPAVVTNGDVHYNGMHYGAQDFAAVPSYQPKLPSTSLPHTSRPSAAPTPPTLRTPKDALAANSIERLQSVSSLWNASPSQQMSTSPQFPAGLPTGTLSSPAQIARHGHSRVNSASSIRSRTSQNVVMGDSWSSLDSAPRVQAPTGPVDGYSNFTASAMASPLLFGAGSNMWNRNVSPPNGQGG